MFLDKLNRTVAPYSLVAFRIIYGTLISIGAIRFLQNDWVTLFYERPTFFFKFWGAEWLVVGSPETMRYILLGLIVMGLMIALGLFYRIASICSLILLAYLELTDVTNYLNHYYQLVLLGFLCVVLPLHSTASIDSLLWKRRRHSELRQWMIWLVQFQVGLVYLGATLAKCNADWLFHGQPLNIWFLSRTDTPWIGSFLQYYEVALVASWAGFLHDLLIVPALLWKRSRPWAYLVLIVFHALTGLLFNIGMFPWIMIGTATVFLDPSWPKHLSRFMLRRQHTHPQDEPNESTNPMALGKFSVGLLALWMAFHVVMPLRSFAYTGPVDWHEQGYRFSWKVMTRKKNGAVTYRVSHEGRTRERLVYPSAYLTNRQEREMSGQPDLILQMAHHIGEDFEERGYSGLEVRVDAFVSWNGRKPARLIDSGIDLLTVDNSLHEAHWIEEAPTEAPPHLGTKLYEGWK